MQIEEKTTYYGLAILCDFTIRYKNRNHAISKASLCNTSKYFRTLLVNDAGLLNQGAEFQSITLADDFCDAELSPDALSILLNHVANAFSSHDEAMKILDCNWLSALHVAMLASYFEMAFLQNYYEHGSTKVCDLKLITHDVWRCLYMAEKHRLKTLYSHILQFIAKFVRQIALDPSAVVNGLNSQSRYIEQLSANTWRELFFVEHALRSDSFHGSKNLKLKRHFADNQSVRCCALSKHWHNGFKKSVFCFPHLAVPIGSATTLSDDEPKRGPIAYQLLRARIMLVPDFDFDILSTYEALRHIVIRQVFLHFCMSNNLSKAINKLPALQTIALHAEDGGRFANRDFIASLPPKVTSLDLCWEEDVEFFESQFPNLLYFNAPWEEGMDIFCEKMPNLRHLVFDKMPTSFHFLTVMNQLQSFTWTIHVIKRSDWDQFAGAVSTTVNRLYIECYNFADIVASGVALPSVTTFYLRSRCTYLISSEEIRRLFPNLQHFHLCLHQAQDENMIELFLLTSKLESFSLYFSNSRMTYFKGDKKVSTCSSLTQFWISSASFGR